MATFEFDDSGINDFLDSLKFFNIPCPECDKEFEISMDDIGAQVTCPYCAAEITVQSED